MKIAPLLKISIYYFTLLLIFTSCGSKNTTIDNTTVFRYNEYGNISSLDPAFSKDNASIWACNQLFNGLVQLNDALQVKPDIATKWSISNDGKTYVFHLRDDAYFHKNFLFKNNTRAATAYDFEYSFSRLIDPKIASPGSWVLQQVSSFKATNNTTFVIELKQAFPAFLGLLSMKYCSVVPKEVITHYGIDFRNNPIGTGPFKFKRWEENIKLVLRKNNDYYEKDKYGKNLPYLEAIAISFLTDKQSEFLQFAQGNLDFISGIDPSYKDELLTTSGTLREKHKNTVTMFSGDYLNTEYLGFYMDSKLPEIQSVLIRKAINYGFDRKKMITYLRNGIGTPAENGFIPKGLPGFNNQEGFTYQPEKAATLVQQFQKESGITNPKITISTNSNYIDLCEYIQRELEKIGLIVDIDLLTSSTLREEKTTGKLDCFRASWIADYPDAENYMSLFYSKNFTPNGPNYTHFKDDTFDLLYETALQETNTEIRHALYTKMDSILIQKAPVIPLYYDQVLRFSQKNITGLDGNPINLLHLKRVLKN